MPGLVAAGFERLATEFKDIAAETPSGGGMFSVYHRGEPVVDLWAGQAAPGSEWQRNSLQVIWSGTKGLVAACILKLIERGQLSLDRPVADYWPEFAVNGKAGVLVRQALSHRDGITGISTVGLPLADICDDMAMEALVANEPLPHDPRAFAAYHPLTFGWICGGLVRRVDGRSVGQFFEDEFARPLDLDLWIGLPELQLPRVGRLAFSESWKGGPPPSPGAPDFDPFTWRTWGNPNIFEGDLPWNTRRFHQAEIAGVGAIGNARSVARFYAALANDGVLDGIRVLEKATIREGRSELTRFTDPVAERVFVLGTGFWLQNPEQIFGPVDQAFGHPGAGVSIHGAWPQSQVAFSFIPNVMQNDEADLRARRLLAMLWDCIR